MPVKRWFTKNSELACYFCHQNGSLHPVQVPRWPSNIVPGIKAKFKDFSDAIYKKINSPRPGHFSPGSYAKIMFKKKQRFHKMSCYFDQNPKRNRSICLSNFDGKLQNILFTCTCPCLFVSVISVSDVA